MGSEGVRIQSHPLLTGKTRLPLWPRNKLRTVCQGDKGTATYDSYMELGGAGGSIQSHPLLTEKTRLPLWSRNKLRTVCQGDKGTATYIKALNCRKLNDESFKP